MIQSLSASEKERRDEVSYIRTDMDEIEEQSKCISILRHLRKRYALFLTKYPWIPIIIVLLVTLIASGQSFVKSFGAKPFPDFSNPGKGMEAKGTEISRRILSFNSLHSLNKALPRITRSSTAAGISAIASTTIEDTKSCPVHPGNYFRAKTVYAAVDGEDDLFQVNHLKEICELEMRLIRNEPLFDVECKRNSTSHSCCPSLSIGYFAAVLNKRSSCLYINESDVYALRGLIDRFKTRLCEKETDLMKACKDKKLQTGFSSTEQEIVCNILQFMVDRNFAKSCNAKAKLKYAVVFSAIKSPSELFVGELYERKIKDKDMLKGRKVEMVAFDIGRMKLLVYNKFVVNDVKFAWGALSAVICLTWFYSGSIFISVFSLAAIPISLLISYWFYSVVLDISFFPALNVVTVILIVGIGADDVYIYVSAWRRARQTLEAINPDVEAISKWTDYTLSHAASAMFVTSCTTAAAMFSCYSSQIVALKSFSIFASITILFNYLLMITWLPTVLILSARFNAFRRKTVMANESSSTVASWYKNVVKLIARWLHFIRGVFKHNSYLLFGNKMPRLIIKLRYLWIFSLLCLMLFGIISLTVYPKLTLPTNGEFQLFTRDHRMEVYDSKVKSKLQLTIVSPEDRFHFPVAVVWGIRAVDTGTTWELEKAQKVEFDHRFDLSKEENQLAMLKFCKDIKKADFYDKVRNDATYCFMETFELFLKLPCFFSDFCCKKSLPLRPNDFKRCTKELDTLISIRTFYRLPITMRNDGHITAMIVPFYSNVAFDLKYSVMDSFWKKLKSWEDDAMRGLPDGVNQAWTISELYFYDFQRSLVSGTLQTVGLSIAMSAIVLLLTTCNVIITIYAIISITATISVTTGSLVMAGWHLDVIESMTMTVAVGLSIDFVLHYGIAYYACAKDATRKERIETALRHVGSAVTLGGVTTFIAGFVMILSVIHAYIQIGHFVMLIMSMSWVYSTFFFLSLCAVLGPVGHFGHIIRCWKIRNSKTKPFDSIEETSQETVIN